jgi:hypothetical protein
VILEERLRRRAFGESRRSGEQKNLALLPRSTLQSRPQNDTADLPSGEIGGG